MSPGKRLFEGVPHHPLVAASTPAPIDSVQKFNESIAIDDASS